MAAAVAVAGCGSNGEESDRTTKGDPSTTTLGPTETLTPDSAGESTEDDGTATTATDSSTAAATATPTETATATRTPTATPTQTAAPRDLDGDQSGRVAADDADGADLFGRSVALDGDTALVGASSDADPNGERAGSAYVFSAADGSWTQTAKLVAEDGDAEDVFGRAVALSGDTALVGAPGDEDPNGSRAGSAYVFSRSSGGWTQTAKLAAPDGASDDTFGRAVALDGDTALVGAYGTDTGAGAAYVFSGGDGSWSFDTDLGSGVDLDRNDGFGWDVAVDGGTALVGAGGDQDPNGDFAGSAYVFSRSGGSWSRAAKLAAGDGDSNDFFGKRVALSGDVALVGSPDDDPGASDAGSVYAFGRDGGNWNQHAKLTARDGDADDNFGESVAVDGDVAVVGAFRDEDPNGTFAGSAYAFARAGDSWFQRAKLVAEDGDSYDGFGVAVGVHDGLGLIGANAADAPSAGDAGAAYLFDL